MVVPDEVEAVEFVEGLAMFAEGKPRLRRLQVSRIKWSIKCHSITDTEETRESFSELEFIIGLEMAASGPVATGQKQGRPGHTRGMQKLLGWAGDSAMMRGP